MSQAVRSNMDEIAPAVAISLTTVCGSFVAGLCQRNEIFNGTGCTKSVELGVVVAG